MRARILNASAGSGKTYQLAYKYVRDVVEQPTLYRHILAVTFTNKATEEMKSRILSEIHTLASGGKSGYLASLCTELSLDERTVRTRAREARTRILHDYSRFTILTIDTFFQRILRAFIQELGLDLNYNVEIETASVLSKSADALVEQIRIDEELQRWLTAFVQERIEDGKRWDVREGILALGNEIFKESNRETLSAERSKAELDRIVGKATGRAKAGKKEFQELGVRAMNLMNTAGVTTADFTGKSRSFAGYFAAAAAGEIKAPTATVRKMSATTEGWCAKDSPALPLVAELQPLLAELCARYDRSIRFWNTTDLLRENYRSFALLQDLYGKVRQMCSDENVMMLSETKNILSEFIRHNDAPFIYEKVGNRYDRFMIDEFQDTSTREWENFLPLLGNAMAQSEQTSVLRGKATGLVFSNFCKRHIITREQAKSYIRREVDEMQGEYFIIFTSGLDTAYSTKSPDTIAMSFMGITNKGKLIVLDEKVYNNAELDIPIAPSDTVRNYIDFLERNRKEWGGMSKNVFIDNADQATITEFAKYKREHIDCQYIFNNAYKKVTIIDRINLQLGWMSFNDEKGREPSFYIVDTCTNYKTELETYSWLEDKDCEPEDGNDHMVNSVQYGWIPYRSRIGIENKT